jgi:hypothetical protein
MLPNDSNAIVVLLDSIDVAQDCASSRLAGT